MEIPTIIVLDFIIGTIFGIFIKWDWDKDKKLKKKK